MDRLLTRRKVAVMWGVSWVVVRQWERFGGLPPAGLKETIVRFLGYDPLAAIEGRKTGDLGSQ